MKVKLKHSMAGPEGSHKPGAIVDLDKATALRMIDAGLATRVGGKKRETAELVSEDKG